MFAMMEPMERLSIRFIGWSIMTATTLLACGARSTLDGSHGADLGTGGAGGGTNLTGSVSSVSQNASSSVSSGSTSTGGVCSPETLATVPPRVTGLAVDGDSVYWGTGDGSIMERIGGTTSVLAVAAPPIRTIAVDANNVFFTAGASLLSVSRSGGETTTIGQYGNPRQIVAADGIVYLLIPSALPTNGGVTRVDPDGSATLLITDLIDPEGLAIDSEYVYTTGDAGTINGQYVVGPLVRAPLTGGPTEILATGLHLSSNVAVDATRVYFVDEVGTHGRLGAVDKVSGQLTELDIDPPGTYSSDVAVDGQNAYVTGYRNDQPQGTLRRIALDGSAKDEIADTYGLFNVVRLNSDAIFLALWFPDGESDDDTGVRKLCK
jgi:hypothetical protein